MKRKKFIPLTNKRSISLDRAAVLLDDIALSVYYEDKDPDDESLLVIERISKLFKERFTDKDFLNL